MGRVVLGVSSSISVYKSCEIIREFQKRGYRVQVIMTKNASKLISPLLLSSLSGEKALVDLFEERDSAQIAHVALASEAELFVVAPATANIIAKFASGIADDFLSTFYTVVKCPVVVAPAMNEAMYFHPQTQKNLKKLKEDGVKIVEPEKGYLACQEEGWGRLATPEKIVEEGLVLIKKRESLVGRKIMVSAGPTREFMDPVRFISNRSSGKMGYELALEAWRRGADVILVSGPSLLQPPREVRVERVQSAEEMGKKMFEHLEEVEVVIMAAAVSDYKFAEKSSQKIKKGTSPRRLQLVPTEDILEKIGSSKGSRVVVGFAAETENMVENALKKIKQKNLDFIVANNILREGVGFESDFNQVSIIFPDGQVIETEKMSKREISQVILDKIEEIIGKKTRENSL